MIKHYLPIAHSLKRSIKQISDSIGQEERGNKQVTIEMKKKTYLALEQRLKYKKKL